MRVKCLAQEHNTMFPARARTRTARSKVERANHEATAPPLFYALPEKIHKDINYIKSCRISVGQTRTIKAFIEQ